MQHIKLSKVLWRLLSRFRQFMCYVHKCHSKMSDLPEFNIMHSMWWWILQLSFSRIYKLHIVCYRMFRMHHFINLHQLSLYFFQKHKQYLRTLQKQLFRVFRHFDLFVLQHRLLFRYWRGLSGMSVCTQLLHRMFWQSDLCNLFSRKLSWLSN